MHKLQTSPYAAEITAKKFLVRKIFRGSVFRVSPKISGRRQKFAAAACWGVKLINPAADRPPWGLRSKPQP
jgi:hypothetical protein